MCVRWYTMNSEPTITCSNCKTAIKLTESLAAPLIEATRRDFEKRLAEKDAEVSKKEASLKEGAAALAKERESLDEQVAAKLESERTKLIAEEARKLRLAHGIEVKEKADAIADLEEI